MNAQPRRILGALAAAAVLLYGWSFLTRGDADGRIGISGTVTYNGWPLQAGRIQFDSAPGSSGPTASGMIMDGTYHIATEDGVLPGTYEATILIAGYGELVNGKKALFDSQPGRPVVSLPDRQQKCFSWPIPQVIAPGERDVELNFDLPTATDEAVMEKRPSATE